MHNQKPSNRKITVIISLIALLVIGGAGAYFALRGVDTKPVPVAKPAVFSFDADTAPGWYKSPLDTTTKEGRTSLLVFDYDIKAPQDPDDTQSCHLSAFLKSGRVDIGAKRKAIEEMKIDDRKTSLIDTKDLSLKKSSGSEKYTLYRYDSTGGSEQYKDGTAFGYVQTDSHHIEIQVVCDTFNQLESATDALKAIRFDENAPKE